MSLSSSSSAAAATSTNQAAPADAGAASTATAASVPPSPSVCHELCLCDVGADSTLVPSLERSLKALAFSSAQSVGTVLLSARVHGESATMRWQQVGQSLPLFDSLVDALTREVKPIPPAQLPLFDGGGVDVGVFVRAALAKVDEKTLKPTLDGAAFQWSKRK
jgi:hypothetical protein